MSHLGASEGVEPFVRVTDEGEIHFGHVLFAQSFDLRPISSGVIALIDLVGGEVGDVDVRGQARFKGGADRSELVPVNPVEKRVFPNVGAAELARRGA